MRVQSRGYVDTIRYETTMGTARGLYAGKWLTPENPGFDDSQMDLAAKVIVRIGAGSVGALYGFAKGHFLWLMKASSQ